MKPFNFVLFGSHGFRPVECHFTPRVRMLQIPQPELQQASILADSALNWPAQSGNTFRVGRRALLIMPSLSFQYFESRVLPGRNLDIIPGGASVSSVYPLSSSALFCIGGQVPASILRAFMQHYLGCRARLFYCHCHKLNASPGVPARLSEIYSCQEFRNTEISNTFTCVNVNSFTLLPNHPPYITPNHNPIQHI